MSNFEDSKGLIYLKFKYALDSYIHNNKSQFPSSLSKYN